MTHSILRRQQTPLEFVKLKTFHGSNNQGKPSGRCFAVRLRPGKVGAPG